MVGESELWLHVKAILILAVGGGVVALAIWRLSPTTRRRPLPLPREPRRQWSGQEVFLAFVFFVLAPPAVLALFEHLGVFAAIYDKTASMYRKQLWVWPLATPLVVAGIFMALYSLSRTRPSAYGMTPVRAGPNVVAGYLAWLVLAPVAIAVFFTALQGMSEEALVRERHPLEKLAREHVPVMPVEWVLMVFHAVVAAALLEELVFRGVLLGWLRHATLTGHIVVAALGILRSFLAMIEPLFPEQGPPGDLKVAPLVFALLLVPVYLVPVFVYQRRLSSRRAEDGPALSGAGIDAPNGEAPAGSEGAAATGGLRPPLAGVLRKVQEFFLRTPARQRALAAWGPVVGSAYLFSTFHSAVWPSPIPLLFLGLGLGWLAYRTGSLVGPVVVHALFNAVACLVLAFIVLQAAANGRAETTALRPSVSGSIVKVVPGSWLPRFK